VQKEKPITIPDDILGKYLSQDEVKTFNKGATGIFSITVYAEKQGTMGEKPKAKLSEISTTNTCTPGNGCC
ncbi:MAG: arsenite S-adenosylmethyltransferase, partial [Gillisia sp.]|nr:arsenite S-adenosylmethyltransferase [Gillisia sp.]